MVLIQEALQREQDREPKLDKIEEIFNKSIDILEKKGKNLHPNTSAYFHDEEIPYKKAKCSIRGVKVDLLAHYILTKARILKKSDYDLSSITISIEDLHKEIYLKGPDTKISDSSVNPEKIMSIDEFTEENLDQWEEIIDLIEKEIK